MNPVSTDNLLAQLSAFHFWRIQTINGDRRRWQCRINHDHHYYEATASSPQDAMRAAIKKVNEGWKPKRAKGPKEVVLKLAE